MRFLLVLMVLLLPVAVLGEHLYSDLGSCSLTAYWGEHAPSVYDNPAACGEKTMAGAIYFEKYGFSELGHSMAFAQVRTGCITAGAYVLEVGCDLRKEETYALYAAYSWEGRILWGCAVKYLISRWEEQQHDFSYDFGAVWNSGVLSLGLSVKDAGHPQLGDKVTHTVIASALCRRGDFALSMKHASLYSRYSYTVAGLHWFPRENARFSYAVNNGNDEHRFALFLRRGVVSAEVAYVVHPLLNSYTVAGVMLCF